MEVSFSIDTRRVGVELLISKEPRISPRIESKEEAGRLSEIGRVKARGISLNKMAAVTYSLKKALAI